MMHHPDCDVNDVNPDGITKPCNCQERGAALVAPVEAASLGPCFTHFSKHCPEPWLAIHRESALQLLKDYNLTDLQKADISYLMAGYCNVLDNAGLLHYGQTEAEAVAKACGLKTTTPNEH